MSFGSTSRSYLRNFFPILPLSFLLALPPANSAFSVFRARCFTRVAFRAAFDSYAIFFGFTLDFFLTDAVLACRAADEAG